MTDPSYSSAARAAVLLGATTDLGRNDRAAVLAVAVLADGGFGAGRTAAVTAHQVARLVGLATSTTERNLANAAATGVLEQVVGWGGVTHTYRGAAVRSRPKGSTILGYRVPREDG